MLAAGARGLGLVGLAVLVGIALLQATDTSSTLPRMPIPAAGQLLTTTTGSGGSSATTTTRPVGGARPPAQVKVLVLNAAGRPGAAAAVSRKLQGLGYATLAPANASKAAPQTTVYFKPGFETEAAAVAGQVGTGVRSEPLPDPSPYAGTDQANVVVVVGVR